MTINHRAEAERHLSKASFMTGDGPNATPVNPAAADHYLRMAQVHATLATGQALVADASAYRAALASWRDIVAHFVAWGLSFAENDDEHGTYLRLAQRLDEAGLNIDNDIDKITPEFGKDPRGMWKPPTVRRAEWAAECAATNPPF
ncbi:hypothetical protein ACFWG6_31130 [Streptomyces erythrochromogenes]|uniref:hypothetical protein n=1 Tax=Streptomyces erythrochromogenes TaxID=285574 RepID=UPI003631100B